MFRRAGVIDRLTVVVLLMLLGGLPARPVAGQAAPGPAAADVMEDGPPVSPRGAFLRSLVLPGWGQAYAGAPGRGAIFFSMAAGSSYMTYTARRLQRDAVREQTWLRDTGQIEPTAETEFALARARHFEDWAALSLFLLFLSGADAYVAAYLADFDERIGVLPDPDGGLQFRLSVPVGRAR
jgi:hypothetical protein